MVVVFIPNTFHQESRFHPFNPLGTLVLLNQRRRIYNRFFKRKRYISLLFFCMARDKGAPSNLI